MKKEKIIPIAGLFIYLPLIIYVDSQYAQSGVYFSWWNVAAAVLWLLVWCVMSRKQVVMKFKILSLVIACVVIAGLYAVLVPEYTYDEAVEIISEEQNCDIATLYDTDSYQHLTWDYTQCRREHPNYLIVFAEETPRSFMFDPYNGWYEEFDVEALFPFVLENLDN